MSGWNKRDLWLGNRILTTLYSVGVSFVTLVWFPEQKRPLCYGFLHFYFLNQVWHTFPCCIFYCCCPSYIKLRWCLCLSILRRGGGRYYNTHSASAFTSAATVVVFNTTIRLSPAWGHSSRSCMLHSMWVDLEGPMFCTPMKSVFRHFHVSLTLLAFTS